LQSRQGSKGSGRLLDGEAEVQAKDDDRAVVDRQPSKAGVELLPNDELRRGVGDRRFHVEDRDRRAVAAGAAELVGDRPHEQASQPGIELGDVAERGQVPPAADERLLDGILRAICVSQDEAGDGVEPVDGRRGEDVERLALAGPRPRHEGSPIAAHAVSSAGSSWILRFTPYRRRTS
jgi:hypothetical protein